MNGRYLYNVPMRGKDRGPGISRNGLEGSPSHRYLASNRNKVRGVAPGVFLAHLCLIHYYAQVVSYFL